MCLPLRDGGPGFDSRARTSGFWTGERPTNSLITNRQKTTDMSETAEVTETVFRQYEQVQRSGATNMVMRGKVRDVAEELGFDELVAFIEEDDYYEILNNYDVYASEFGHSAPGQV